MFGFCIYKSIILESDDFHLYFGEWSEPFSKDFLVPSNHEFIYVECRDKENQTLVRNYHYVVTIKPYLEKECEERFENCYVWKR